MKLSPYYNKQSNKQSNMTKEQFLIAWALARASCIDASPNVYAIVRNANEVWQEIQKLKESK